MVMVMIRVMVIVIVIVMVMVRFRVMVRVRVWFILGYFMVMVIVSSTELMVKFMTKFIFVKIHGYCHGHFFIFLSILYSRSCTRHVPVAGDHHGDGAGVLLHRAGAHRRDQAVQVGLNAPRVYL